MVEKRTSTDTTTNLKRNQARELLSNKKELTLKIGKKKTSDNNCSSMKSNVKRKNEVSEQEKIRCSL